MVIVIKQIFCISRGFATAAAKPDQNLERSLKRLDQDVRRLVIFS